MSTVNDYKNLQFVLILKKKNKFIFQKSQILRWGKRVMTHINKCAWVFFFVTKNVFFLIFLVQNFTPSIC